MKTHLFTLLLALVVTSCQSVNLDETPPKGFDLTGTWKVDAVLSDPPPQKNAGHKSNNKSRPDPGRRGNQRSTRARPPSVNTPLAFITRDFPVLASRQMQIEQNHDSMGVSYDRGNYRDVSWGERDRGYWRVNAGWEDGEFVIFSKSSDQAVFERHSLSSDGRTLVVKVVYHDPLKDLKLTRVFYREP